MFEGLVESTKQTIKSVVVHCSSCSKARLSTEQSHSTGKLTVGCIDLERAFVSVFNYKIKQLQHLTVTCHLLRDCLVTYIQSCSISLYHFKTAYCTNDSRSGSPVLTKMEMLVKAGEEKLLLQF